MKAIEEAFWQALYYCSRENIFDPIRTENLKEEVNRLYGWLIHQNIPKLQLEDAVLEYYWKFCSAKTYKLLYDRRLELFLNENIDEDELDFLTSELKSLTSLSSHLKDQPPVLNAKSIRLDNAAYKKKKEFIENRLNILGVSEIMDAETKQANKKNPSGILDLNRDNKGNINLSKVYEELTAYQKVLLLNKFSFFNEFPENPQTGTINYKFVGDILKLITGDNSNNIREKVKLVEHDKSQISTLSNKLLSQFNNFERLWDELTKNMTELN